MRNFLEKLIGLLYPLWIKTLRIRINGNDPAAPCAYVFWHSKVFPLPYSWRNRGICALVSAHRDGEMAAGLLLRYGYMLARGSSTRGGIRGGKKLLDALKKGASIAITPDGPKGPRWHFKEETFKLLEMAGVPAVLIGVGYSRHRKLGSWDRFEVPVPFSRCVIELKEVDPREKSREEMEELLLKINREAERKASGEG